MQALLYVAVLAADAISVIDLSLCQYSIKMMVEIQNDDEMVVFDPAENKFATVKQSYPKYNIGFIEAYTEVKKGKNWRIGQKH